MSVPNGVSNGHHDEKSQVQTESVLGIENVRDTHAAPYMANFKAHKPGISHEEMVEAYDEWANNYDRDVPAGVYNGPQIAAEMLGKLYEPAKRETLRILDVAAGTGAVGYELSKLGFKLIDALEPSGGMLRVLEGRNVYSTKYHTPIGSKATHAIIPEKIYDCLVIAGGMGEGHIPANALNEMIRLVKPGGRILIVMREEYLSYVSDYTDKLEPLMREFERRGYWKQLSRLVVPGYSFDKNGVIFSYQVTSNEFPV